MVCASRDKLILKAYDAPWSSACPVALKVSRDVSGLRPRKGVPEGTESVRFFSGSQLLPSQPYPQGIPSPGSARGRLWVLLRLRSSDGPRK